jgi:hypothetical protein
LHLRPREVPHGRCNHRVEAATRLRGIDNELMSRFAPRLRVITVVVVYQIFDLTWPLDLMSTSTMARS